MQLLTNDRSGCVLHRTDLPGGRKGGQPENKGVGRTTQVQTRQDKRKTMQRQVRRAKKPVDCQGKEEGRERKATAREERGLHLATDAQEFNKKGIPCQKEALLTKHSAFFSFLILLSPALQADVGSPG